TLSRADSSLVRCHLSIQRCPRAEYLLETHFLYGMVHVCVLALGLEAVFVLVLALGSGAGVVHFLAVGSEVGFVVLFLFLALGLGVSFVLVLFLAVGSEDSSRRGVCCIDPAAALSKFLILCGAGDHMVQRIYT
ncbi:hypothetical protein BJ138DRAFT_1163705, partial [Hygrophoropsis aurantiaca]